MPGRIIAGVAALVLLRPEQLCWAADEICQMRFNPMSRELILSVNSAEWPDAIYEVYACATLESFGSGAWQLVREDVRVGTNGWAEADLAKPEADRGFFAVGRADIDRDENGIADVREKLVSVYNVPMDQRARWARVLASPVSLNYTNIINAKNAGARGDGTTDDTAALNKAINSLKTPGVLYLPSGRYRLTQPLYLKPDMVLRGAGAGATKLCFVGLGTAGRCIAIAQWDSQQTNPWYNVLGGFTQGSTQIVLTAITGIQTGDVVEIEQDNAPAWNLNESWQARLQGQLACVVAVHPTSKTVTIDTPLRIGYQADRNPKLRKLVTIRNVGIEDLYVERVDAVDGHTIELKYAVNCWVRRVESAWTYKAHVWIERGLGNKIRESYFHHAHAYGGGGQGYGVGLGRHTSETLVENNIFNGLRHSMSVGHGANGNVFAYNFSTNRALDPVSKIPQADISVHGNWVYMNLFEGNVVEDADVPDWYFPAGPGNTLFRNRMVNRGTAVEVASDHQNVIGNECPAGCVAVDSTVKAVLQHGNCLSGTTVWQPNQCRNLPPSYFRCVRPDFIPWEDPKISWPPIGPGRAPEAGNIPAEQRYAVGEYIPSDS